MKIAYVFLELVTKEKWKEENRGEMNYKFDGNFYSFFFSFFFNFQIYFLGGNTSNALSMDEGLSGFFTIF